MFERSSQLSTFYRDGVYSEPETFYVKTDSEYRLRYGDRTIEVYGDADIIFDDVYVEGYGVWIIRHHDQGGAQLIGYTCSGGRWLEVS